MTRKEEYHKYLLSPEWKAFRVKVFEHYGKKCAECKRTKRLHIHHKTYENIFNEKLEDVIVLCDLHHAKIHGIKPKKDKKIKKQKKKVAFKPSKRQRKKQRQMKKVRGNHQAKTQHPNLDLIIANKRRREEIRNSENKINEYSYLNQKHF